MIIYIYIYKGWKEEGRVRKRRKDRRWKRSIEGREEERSDPRKQMKEIWRRGKRWDKWRKMGGGKEGR